MAQNIELELIDFAEYDQARQALDAIVHKDRLPPADLAAILRAYARIALGELQEEAAIRSPTDRTAGSKTPPEKLPLLTKPRHKMGPLPHRKYGVENPPKTLLT